MHPLTCLFPALILVLVKGLNSDSSSIWPSSASATGFQDGSDQITSNHNMDLMHEGSNFDFPSGFPGFEPDTNEMEEIPLMNEVDAWSRGWNKCKNHRRCEKLYGKGYQCKKGECVFLQCRKNIHCRKHFGKGYYCRKGNCYINNCKNDIDCLFLFGNPCRGRGKRCWWTCNRRQQCKKKVRRSGSSLLLPSSETMLPNEMTDNESNELEGSPRYVPNYCTG